jgi:hypothetical protein
MHLESTRSFDEVKKFGEVLMRSPMKISIHIPAGWIQCPKPAMSLEKRK